MATGTLAHPSAGAVRDGGALIAREVASWLTARVHDAAPEAVFTLECDARFYRLRRVRGAAASSIEARLPMPVTPGDLAQAVARWAPTAGLAARVHAEADGLRLTLSRPQD